MAAKKEETPMVRRKIKGAADNVVVIMPFNLDAQTSTEDKQQMRSVEFYEVCTLFSSLWMNVIEKE